MIHILLGFSLNDNNDPANVYTTGVTQTGTPGTSGAKHNNSCGRFCTNTLLLLCKSFWYGCYSLHFI